MNDVIEVIEKAVAAALNGKTSSRVLVRPTVDSEGQDALGVTIVLGDADLSGRESLRLLVEVHDALTAAGDSRFVIVDVASEGEMALDGDP